MLRIYLTVTVDNVVKKLIIKELTGCHTDKEITINELFSSLEQTHDACPILLPKFLLQNCETKSTKNTKKSPSKRQI